MKKIPAIVAASFLATTLVACGGNDTPQPMEDTVTMENTNPNTGVTEIQEDEMQTSGEAIALGQEFVETQATVAEASKILEEKQYAWRLTKINEADLAVTMDYQPNRFNFEVQGNDEDSYRIVKVTFG
jgi:hypothetical protein